MTTESTEPRATDKVALGTETWEADLGPESSAAELARAIDASDTTDEELEVLARVRSAPWRVQHMMILVAVIALVFWLIVTLGWLLLVLFLLTSFAMIVGLGFIVARLRVSRQDTLLQILAIAAERGMPLSTAVAAFADQFRGRSRLRALNVIESLNAGTPLPEALEATPRAVSRDAVLMAWIGQETGLLPKALRLAGTYRAAHLSIWMATASRLAYLLGMILALQVIVALLLYRVVPSLEAIFRDFNIGLPEITRYVGRMSRRLSDYAPASAMIGISELALLLYIPFSFGGWMNFKVPIFDRLLTRRHAGLIMRALSLVIESNRPIDLGLATLAKHYPTRWVRRRLARVEKDVRLGADWIDALWRLGLFRRTDAEVLASAASVGNLMWALRELAETGERRLTLHIRTALQIFFPLSIIMLGAAVAMMALAYFLPLVVLIRGLTES